MEEPYRQCPHNTISLILANAVGAYRASMAPLSSKLTGPLSHIRPDFQMGLKSLAYWLKVYKELNF
jgi:hypothetical protein